MKIAQRLDQRKYLVRDSWLTEVFNHDAYRLCIDERFMQKIEKEMVDFFRELQERPCFLYAKVPTGQIWAAKFLESLRFNLIDTEIVLEKPVNSKPELIGYSTVRFAQPQDREQVGELARRNLKTSRFHLDFSIPSALADRIKQEWALNYFKGRRGDQMVVAFVDNQIAGFLQLLLKERTIVVDLIATDEPHRQKGIATDMIAFVESNVNGCTKICVGTQISNLPSISLYEKLGFRICSSEYVFHYRHLPPDSE